MSRVIDWFAPLLVACFVPSSVAQTPQYRLRLSDQVGQTSLYRLTFEMRMRAEYSGVEVDEEARPLIEALASGMSMRTAVEYEQTLAAVEEDGTRNFELRWQSYDFSGTVGEIEVPPPPGYAASASELLSQTALVRTTPTGHIVDVTYSQPRMGGLAGQFRQMRGAMPTYLPEGSVAVGERWSSTTEVPVRLSGDSASTMALELEHTLRELRAGPHGLVAVIDVAGSYKQLLTMGQVTIGIPMHMEARLTGSTAFDLSRGRYNSGSYEIDMFALHASSDTEIQLIGRADGTLELLTSR